MKKATAHRSSPASKDGGLAMVEESVLNQFTNTDGNVTINVAEFLKLVRHASAQDKADEPKPSPVPWQVVGLDVCAETNANCVSFTCDFVVRSFSQEWVKVPLLPALYALDKFSVSGLETGSAAGTAAAGGDIDNDVELDARQPSVIASGGSSGDVSVLLPSPGEYKVSLSGLAPFDNERKSGFKLNFKPDVLRSSLTCTVHDADLDIKVDPALSTTLEALPPNPPLTSAGSTRITCLLGNSKSLNVQWTPKQPEEEVPVGDGKDGEEAVLAAAEEVKKEPLIVVNHSAVHTIGEGVVSTSLSLEYEIVHTTKSVFDILCPSACNIIDVAGSHIKRWKVLHGPSAAPPGSVPVADRADSVISVDTGLDAEIISMSDGGSAAVGPAAVSTLQLQPGQKAVRVMLDYPVQGKYALSITADLPMESTSCAVTIPPFDAAGANRQKGFVGVEAKTNVEVREVKKLGVARVDVSELPAAMTRAGKAYLHAYKFLMPRYSIELDVKRHADAEVLTAVIEEAWLTATVSESGSSLSRVLLVVRNTQRQFLRITLPDCKERSQRANIWSAMVNGVAVKPAIDNENTVLIPLLKASPDAADSNTVLYVELVFLEDLPLLTKKGQLALGFARFDLPVQRMFVTAYLPTNYDYGQFAGDLKEVQSHGKAPPNVRAQAGAGGLARPAPRQTRAPLRRQIRQQRSYGEEDDNDSLDSCSLASVELGRRESLVLDVRQVQAQANFLCDEDEIGLSVPVGGALDRGVVPVAISAMQEGTAFCFERLLVQPESGSFSVSVPYTQKNVVVRNTSRCAVM